MKSAKSARAHDLMGQVCRIPLPEEERRQRPYYPTKLQDITWRIFRIMAEFVEGFQFLAESSREVSIFGSARFDAKNPWYKEARKLGGLLAKAGFTVITGGGPGVMEAANRGAFEAKGESLGLNIQLPKEQRTNPYVTRSRAFHYFFTRKVMLAAAAQAYVFFPGGFGTLDEALELVTLVQTGKMQKIPVILVGRKFWGPWLEWVNQTLVREYKTVSREETKLYQVVDTAEEALKIIKTAPDRSFF